MKTRKGRGEKNEKNMRQAMEIEKKETDRETGKTKK